MWEEGQRGGGGGACGRKGGAGGDDGGGENDAMAMRFGLLGTGYWAAHTQGVAIAAHPEAELVGVWGRAVSRAEQVAGGFGVKAFADLDELRDQVDAVAVALPPDVQAELAVRAPADPAPSTLLCPRALQALLPPGVAPSPQ